MRRSLLLAVVAVVPLAACGTKNQPDAARFCERVQAEQGVLTGGVAAAPDVTTVVTRYRELGKLAPVAIRDEWQRLTDVVAQAATMDLSASDASAKLAELAYSSEPAARTVAQWVSDTCGVALRPPLEAPTTAAPPASTIAPPATTARKPATTVRPSPPTTRRTSPSTTAAGATTKPAAGTTTAGRGTASTPPTTRG